MLFRGQQGLLPLEKVVRAFQLFSAEIPDAPVRLWIGTDSQIHGGTTRVVTSITAYREHKGGQSYQYVQVLERALTLAEKLDVETHMSIEVIGKLRELLNQKLIYWELELHIDGGNNGMSRLHLPRVVGWAESMASVYQYAVRTKPDAIGASRVADRYAK
ncbi:ribonuclease H-like YkuK family protein [Heliobacterium mobile]|nr:ribonuclease H-like YkuK family protein [Heliobacterium mobile]